MVERGPTNHSTGSVQNAAQGGELKRWTLVFFLGMLSFGLSGCGVAVMTIHRSTTDAPIHYKTKDELLRHLGAPREVQCVAETNGETWIYEGEQRWGGLFVWAVILPVPLMAPIGRDTRAYRLDYGEVIGATDHVPKRCSVSFFLAPTTPLGRGGGEAGCSFTGFTISDEPYDPQEKAGPRRFRKNEQEAARAKCETGGRPRPIFID